MAYLAWDLLPGIPLHPAWRKPEYDDPKPAGHLVPDRPVARRFLEFRGLGAVLGDADSDRKAVSVAGVGMRSPHIFASLSAGGDAGRLGIFLFCRSWDRPCLYWTDVRYRRARAVGSSADDQYFQQLVLVPCRCSVLRAGRAAHCPSAFKEKSACFGGCSSGQHLLPSGFDGAIGRAEL